MPVGRVRQEGRQGRERHGVWDRHYFSLMELWAAQRRWDRKKCLEGVTLLVISPGLMQLVHGPGGRV